MKIILSKNDIEALLKKYYDTKTLVWNKDGSVTLEVDLPTKYTTRGSGFL
jgi:hypothetical protein